MIQDWTNHPDIAANVWTNPGEVDSNFTDDDGNNFVDDVCGWNFVFGNNDVTGHNGHGTQRCGNYRRDQRQLSAGANPSVFGDALTFTASIAPASATGTVVFYDGTVAISGNLPLSSGTVSFSTALLGGGTHTITAQYSGDATFNGAVSPALIQTVNKVPTEIDLELSLGTTAFTSGTPLTFIANIKPGAASGTVVFFDGDTAISEPIPVNNGSASFTTASLAVGSHAIRAQYSGDANFSASGSQVHKLSIK